jgi:hypothetical protein
MILIIRRILGITLICVIGSIMSTFIHNDHGKGVVTNYDIQAKELEHTQSETADYNDLVQYALKKINEVRITHKLPSVNLSENNAAQIHAENLFATRNQLPSHWTTDGMKPYMKYSEYNGTGYVEQNVAVTGYENHAIEKCEDRAVVCKELEPYLQIDKFQWNMIDNDTLCCENKHKDNILDKVHNSVSIGIAYDDYYFALVQNFENNYIQFDMPFTQDNRQIQFLGKILKDEYEIDSIGIYYDNTPSELLYEQNKDKTSYELGKAVAQVVRPPPVFSQYNQPTNYTLIEANKWIQDGKSIDIHFDISPVVKTDGVYTVVAYLKDVRGGKIPVTSYSIFI